MEISKDLALDYLTVQYSGKCNMYDIKCVQMVALNLDCWELAELTDNGTKGYCEFLNNYDEKVAIHLEEWEEKIGRNGRRHNDKAEN